MTRYSVPTSLSSYLLLAVALLLLPVSSPAATFNIAPSVISNDYAGVLNFDITGLTNGETVLVERFFDSNGNGVPDAQEFVLQSFPLTDGQAFVIGGVTNLHVPGDLGTTAGAISAQVNMMIAGFEQKFIGKHIYRLSSPTGRFSPITVPFTVTNSSYSATLSGLVTSNGVANPYASIVAFIPSGDGMEPRVGGSADGTGHYSLKVPPGTYLLLAFSPGCVCDMSTAPMVSPTAGANISADVALLGATRTISGRVADLGNSSRGLGGLLLPTESQDGKLGVAFTDSNGNFTAPAAPGLWRVGPDDGGVEFLGYVGLENRPGVDCTSGNVSVSILVPKATALITGLVRTDASQPLAGVRLYGHDEQYTYAGSPRTDLNGRYFLGVNAGSWEVNAENSNPELGNYVFSNPGGPVSVAAGQVITRDFTAKAAPYTISGYLKTATGSPVSDIDVYGWATIGSESFNTGGRTDSQGFYSMIVANGAWNIQPACEGNNGLANRNYRCFSTGRQVTVANGNVMTSDFIVQICTGAQITTSTLPNGEVGSPYDTQLQGEACGSWVSWGLTPGSGPLPPGLQLIPDSGWLTGVPSQAGTFTFSVRLADNQGRTADRQFTVTIATSIPLEVVMRFLPDATNGLPYSIQLQANGGQPPYSWSISLGSAQPPPGLSLASDGTISGTPTTTGTFSFSVKVTDSASNSAESGAPFSILVKNPPPPPLVITTTSLPDGTVGQQYSAFVQGTGGQPPYTWGRTIDSANLPDGLVLNGSTGQIVGTPTTSGLFYFKVSLTDQGWTSTSKLLSINVNPGTITGPTLASASRTENGKFVFVINGTQGTTYTIQTSANLQQWNRLWTTNAPSSSFLFVDDSPLPAQRFYRILVGQ